jgi:hypothetical protein|tara:strand:+ start:260 stop:1150 length:891 start_codon:yes stop_codon:yes gene_type:complete
MRLFLVGFLLISNSLFSQDSLEDILGSTSSSAKPISTTFSSTRIVNSHSVEMIPKGVGEFRISHRFGTIEEGFYDIFGLDQAKIRLGYDYGITDKIMVGFGRNSHKKVYDIFGRFSFLNQTIDNSTPITLQYLFASSMKTLRYGKKIPFMQRFAQINQVLIAKKINNLSLQIMPSLMIHEYEGYDKKLFSGVGAAARYLVGKRVAINVEYFARLRHNENGSQEFNRIFNENYNSLGLGIDIEAGGHVFQFHFSNTNTMNEQAFMFETEKTWEKGEICFGFNILREFSNNKKSEKKW